MSREPASILLVDDRPENLLALEAVLEPLGRPLVRALSGSEALKCLLAEDFAVILLDVQMPDMDGFETADYIKRLERTRHIPIIFLTALSNDAGQVYRGYTSGAVDYITKPFEPAVLRAKVSVFVDLHEKDAALRESEQRFHAAFDDAPLGMAILDAHGRCSAVNAALAELAGVPAAELAGTQLSALMLGGAPTPAELAAARAPLEVALRHPSGGRRQAIVRVSPLQVERGRARWLAMLQDVTGERDAQARAAIMAAERSAQHEVAELHGRLEANLLPALRLRDARLLVGTRYRAGEDRLLLGGDFLDAIDAPGDRVALLIGDVSGHGPEAAALGAMLRSAWRGLVLAGIDDERILPTLDELLVRERSTEETFVTACLAFVESDRRTLSCLLAGHPAPLLLADDVASIVAPVGAPLGMLADPSWDAGAVALPAEWALLLYTDGLVEGLDGSAAARRFGTARLAEELTALAPVPSRATDRALDVLLERVSQANGGDLADDVGMLFVRCVTAVPAAARSDDNSVALRLPVDTASVRAARHALEELCVRLHVPADVRRDVRLAVTEACANVVLHAYPAPRAGEFELEAAGLPGEWLDVTVRDFGGGMSRASSTRGAGLGLSLIETLSSQVEIRAAASGGGTEVAMRFMLSGRPHGSGAAQRQPSAPAR